MLILHYTGMETADAALGWLTDAASRVSCHYLVDEEGRVTQIAKEELRAWHAGVASWQGETDVNSRSIGIEIHNPGHELGYPDFPDAQMQSVIALCRDIVTRQNIPAEGVLAHSDVAPARKQDPGEKFAWHRLAAEGVGLWVEPEPPAGDAGLGVADEGPEVEELQTDLARYGYAIDVCGNFNQETAEVVTAFQRHFRPQKVDGRADRSTRLTLRRLLAALDPAA